MLKITVVQPPYFAGEQPDKIIADFLMDRARHAECGELLVLPEYSNAGGLFDVQSEILAMPRAKGMLEECREIAKEKGCLIAINLLEERNGIKNSTYLIDKNGKIAFIYDKIHLPPSEVALGVEKGDGACVCEVDGIRFGFMTCYDIYYNEQIEFLAQQKPDVIIVPGYQRGERTDIIRAQAKLAAFRCNAFIARASYSMNDDEHGGCSMLVSPEGKILRDLGKAVGSVSVDVDPKWKYMRTAGFGGGMVRNDDFINYGIRPEVFKK